MVISPDIVKIYLCYAEEAEEDDVEEVGADITGAMLARFMRERASSVARGLDDATGSVLARTGTGGREACSTAISEGDANSSRRSK